MGSGGQAAVDPGLAQLGGRLRKLAQASRQRRALVLDGAHDWCLQAARSVLAGAGLEQALWVGYTRFPGGHGILPHQTRGLLGRELDAVVFDAHGGFDPEAFGAITGSVRGGGLLLLLTPPLAAWGDSGDRELERITVYPYLGRDLHPRFIRRLVRLVEETGDLTKVSEGGKARLPAELEAIEHRDPEPEEAAPAVRDPACRTEDQTQAVEAVMRVVRGHRRRPVVLVSDRGRGKSAALGIAAGRLLGQGLRRILVTAPRLGAAEPVLSHAERLLGLESVGSSPLEFGAGRMELVAPALLVRERRTADLLLVDEAAGIPGPVLETLLRRFSRIAFATTVHGYEGTGRGFAVRFRQVLDRLTPQWREVRLQEPVRWSPGDPLERFVFQALLLDAVPASAEDLAEVDIDGFVVEPVSQERLLRDELLLAQLFGLLVLAHYRTRPLDLRSLLEGPGQSLWVVRHGRNVAATALVSHEGGFPDDLAEQIWAGWRRPKGHMIPQSLAVHAGLRRAPGLCCDRIVRIAVHPALWRRGLGSRLLGEIVEEARAQGRDLVGASFGASEDLLRFWRRSGLHPVRVGFHRDASSGAHSALMLLGLSAAGQALCADARERLRSQLPDWLGDPLRDLDPGLALALLETVEGGTELSAEDWEDLASFAWGRRDYETCLAAVRRLTVLAMSSASGRSAVSEGEWRLLISRVLQRKGWAEVGEEMDGQGRGQAQAQLRRTVQSLALELGGEAVGGLALRLMELGAESP